MRLRPCSGPAIAWAKGVWRPKLTFLFRPDLCINCSDRIAIIHAGEKRMNRLRITGLAAAAAIFATQAGAQELTGTLKKVKDTGTITIGYRDSSIPVSYLDDNQKPIGF